MAGTKKEVAKKVVEKSGKVAKTVTGSDDGKALFFLILASSCIYLILDVFYGNNKLLSFAKTIFGISDSGNSSDSGISSILPNDNPSTAYEKSDKNTQNLIDEQYNKWLEKGYDNLADWQKKEIDAWRAAKSKVNADASDGFGGGGGTK